MARVRGRDGRRRGGGERGSTRLQQPGLVLLPRRVEQRAHRRSRARAHRPLRIAQRLDQLLLAVAVVELHERVELGSVTEALPPPRLQRLSEQPDAQQQVLVQRGDQQQPCARQQRLEQPHIASDQTEATSHAALTERLREQARVGLELDARAAERQRVRGAAGEARRAVELRAQLRLAQPPRDAPPRRRPEQRLRQRRPLLRRPQRPLRRRVGRSGAAPSRRSRRRCGVRAACRRHALQPELVHARRRAANLREALSQRGVHLGGGVGRHTQPHLQAAQRGPQRLQRLALRSRAASCLSPPSRRLAAQLRPTRRPRVLSPSVHVVVHVVVHLVALPSAAHRGRRPARRALRVRLRGGARRGAEGLEAAHELLHLGVERREHGLRPLVALLAPPRRAGARRLESEQAAAQRAHRRRRAAPATGHRRVGARFGGGGLGDGGGGGTKVLAGEAQRLLQRLHELLRRVLAPYRHEHARHQPCEPRRSGCALPPTHAWLGAQRGTEARRTRQRLRLRAQQLSREGQQGARRGLRRQGRACRRVPAAGRGIARRGLVRRGGARGRHRGVELLQVELELHEGRRRHPRLALPPAALARPPAALARPPASLAARAGLRLARRRLLLAVPPRRASAPPRRQPREPGQPRAYRRRLLRPPVRLLLRAAAHQARHRGAHRLALRALPPLRRLVPQLQGACPGGAALEGGADERRVHGREQPSQQRRALLRACLRLRALATAAAAAAAVAAVGLARVACSARDLHPEIDERRQHAVRRGAAQRSAHTSSHTARGRRGVLRPRPRVAPRECGGRAGSEECGGGGGACGGGPLLRGQQAAAEQGGERAGTQLDEALRLSPRGGAERGGGGCGVRVVRRRTRSGEGEQGVPQAQPHRRRAADRRATRHALHAPGQRQQAFELAAPRLPRRQPAQQRLGPHAPLGVVQPTGLARAQGARQQQPARRLFGPLARGRLQLGQQLRAWPLRAWPLRARCRPLPLGGRLGGCRVRRGVRRGVLQQVDLRCELQQRAGTPGLAAHLGRAEQRAAAREGRARGDLVLQQQEELAQRRGGQRKAAHAQAGEVQPEEGDELLLQRDALPPREAHVLLQPRLQPEARELLRRVEAVREQRAQQRLPCSDEEANQRLP